MNDADYKLDVAISDFDEDRVANALDAGANPVGNTPHESHLHRLSYNYLSNKTLAGDRIYAICELLLKAGADPEFVGFNNWRAVDICIDQGIDELVELHIRYGAAPKQREFR